MPDAVDPLEKLFAASPSPASDPTFTLAVLAEVERREALRTAGRRLAYTALALVLLVTGWPALTALWSELGPGLLAAAPFVAVGLLAIAVTYADRLRAFSVALVRLPGISHL